MQCAPVINSNLSTLEGLLLIFSAASCGKTAIMQDRSGSQLTAAMAAASAPGRHQSCKQASSISVSMQPTNLLVHTVHRLVLLLLLQEKLLPQAQLRVSIYIYIDKPEPNQAAVEGASAG